MAYETKNKASFADIISFCNETKSERGQSPISNHNDVTMETMSLRSKSPPSYNVESTWSSPVHKEAVELSSRKRYAVLNMIAEKNWKVNIRTKIESDLSDQVQQALAPIVTSQKRWSEKKKADRHKNLQMFKFNNFSHNKFTSRFASDTGGNSGGVSGGGSFKYIDVNYVPQHRVLAGGADPFYTKDSMPRSLANLRLPRRNGLYSHSIYGLDEIARVQKHAANIRGGLDVTLLDSHSNINFLTLPKHDANGLRPLVPNVITCNGLSLPNYGANRRCFQTYTKEGMNNLLSSRTRRGKLTHLGHGRYIDKRGVIISRLGPFWPQGYGPVCQCPEFNTNCPKQENLNPVESEHAKPTDIETTSTSVTTSDNNVWLTKSRPSNTRTDNNHSNNHSTNHYNQRTSVQYLSPREAALGNVNTQQTQQQIGGKPQWRGKPVIFDCERSSRTALPHSVPEGLDESLVFESRFESGNLRQVRRIAEYEYELVLRTDMYTNRHTQWYYFRLQKAKPGCTYKFNIINFLKKDSLYNYGMKPLVYSEKLAADKGLGWHRIGDNIKYMSWNNATRNAILSLDLQYYCLEFEVTFKWDDVEDDTIYLAHCYPYTYSDLRRHLDRMMANPEVAQHVKKEVLCETTAGNACFLLTITEFPDREKDKYKDFHQEKQGVVITARVHPGESQASWMMKGVIDRLTSDHPIAQKLRQKFVFKVVPMLNPDGVIVGNYRTSLAARDLNRNYRHPKQTTFPTIWHTKQMVDQFNKDHPIILYCDLHGHSRKHMVFMYGCERKAFYNNYKKNNNKQNDNPYVRQNASDAPERTRAENESDSMDETRDFVEERMFPWLMHRLAPTRFSFHGTKFAVRRSKESTGRVVMFRQMRIWNSFTMEASFSGTKFSKENGRHFNIDDFQLIGRKLCDCVLEYSRVCEDPIVKSRAILDMTRDIAQQLIMKRNVNTSSVVMPDVKTTQAHANNTTKNAQVPRSNISTSNMNKTQAGNLANVKSNISKQLDRIRSKNNNSNVSTVTGDVSNDVTNSVQQMDDVVDNSDNCAARSDNNNTVASDDEMMTHGSGSLTTGAEIPSMDQSCFKLLQSLNIHEMELESETSSESNSDSEPELPSEVSSSSGKNRGSQGNLSGGRKKKRKKRQQKFGKSISAPSNIQPSQSSSRKIADEQKEGKSKVPVASYPGYVNKYANRSNGGIPIFAQERIKERAARRLAELKLAEEDRKQQENQLREQLLMAGIQDGPNITYEIPVSQSDSNGYSEICGVRYKVANQPRKVHYMLYNPYRGQSPTSSQEHRPVVTMRFSPPDQLRQNVISTSQKCDKADIYTPYRVQAPAGRLSNQRGLSSLTELSGSTSPGSPTEPSSSQSSDRVMDNVGCDDVMYEEAASPQESDKFEPRSVVVPVQKYNLSFKMYKKPWKQKPSFNVTAQRRHTDIDDVDAVAMQQEQESTLRDHKSPPNQLYQPNVSELYLPPNMDVAEVMTAHMRYPGQIHRVEAMRPLPRGRTISRGPPMVFGEPVLMNQKPQEPAATALPPGGTQPEKSFARSASFTHHRHAANQSRLRHNETKHEQITSQTQESSYEKQLRGNGPTSHIDNVVNIDFDLNVSSKKKTGNDDMPLFAPRFVALAPPHGQHNREDDAIVNGKGSLTERTSQCTVRSDSRPHPFTVR